MKYETPELTALTPAINAIQSSLGKSPNYNVQETITSGKNEIVAAYADWE